MKAIIRRSGGFAGIEQTREVEISPAQLAKLREWRTGKPAHPDGFTYEVMVDGETFTVDESLAEPLLR